MPQTCEGICNQALERVANSTKLAPCVAADRLCGSALNSDDYLCLAAAFHTIAT